ncbi:hypothetical protein HDV63DRAFT_403278 [Trichoderma sp. SZMC 28014]
MPNIIFGALLEAFDTAEDDTARLELAQVAFKSYGPGEDIWISAERKGNTLLHHVAISEDLKRVKMNYRQVPALGHDSESSVKNTRRVPSIFEAIRTQQRLKMTNRGIRLIYRLLVAARGDILYFERIEQPFTGRVVTPQIRLHDPGCTGMRIKSDRRLHVTFVSLFSHFAVSTGQHGAPRELKVLAMVIAAKEEESTMAKKYLDFGGTIEAVGSAFSGAS